MPLPAYSDPETHTVIITVSSAPISWVTGSGNNLVLNPSDYSHLGLTTITVVLSDTHKSNTYTTTVTVTNRPPEYVTAHTYAAKTMHLGSTEIVLIPAYRDPDNFRPVTVTVTDSHAYPISATVTPT